MRGALIFFLVLYSTAISSNEEGPIVETTKGRVQGFLDKSYRGRTFASFEGIPYAKPPVGDLRFEPPEEATSWPGTLIANTRHQCVQGSARGNMDTVVIGVEDCLYLNVYVPKEAPDSGDNLDVVVHIHGGAFMMGSAHMYAGPKFLMDKDVILVTMNYRLGPFGFLSTEDDVVPGNNGMKDQVLSLKWIRDNIKHFGGNPDSVTITGMSAGGASAHLHYFSPLSKGLFHRGLSEGGTALNPWAIAEKGLDKAKYLATLVGCPIETSEEIVSCLKSRSANEIAKNIPKFSPFGSPLAPFAPVVENGGSKPFLDESPYKMLIDKKVADLPWIQSVTEHEGQLFAIMAGTKLAEFFQHWDIIAPSFLEYLHTVDQSDLVDVNDKIKKQYFKGSPTIDSIGKLAGDRLFFVDVDTAAKLQARANKSPVYFYIFGYQGQYGIANTFGITKERIGPTHGDTALYYFSTPLTETNRTESDDEVKDIFLDWIADYAAGDKEVKISNVKWEEVKGGEDLEYLYFGDPEKIVLKTVRDFGQNSFWQTLPLKENARLSKLNIKDKTEL